MKITLKLTTLFLLGCWITVAAAQEVIPGTPFQRYSTVDRWGRKVTFFLDSTTGSAPLPLMVWVQGTGCASLFGRDGKRITQGVQVLLHDVAAGRARVLAVEKPGVEFLDAQPDAGNSGTCRPEFLREHTLDRWAEAIGASIQAAWKLPGVDSSRTLVIGASEGGIVAVHVSNVLPTVTHAASLSGGGPIHLYDFAEFVRRRKLDPEKEVYDCYKDILHDPTSTTKFCWGHPYRMLLSFLQTSVLEECLRSKAKLYLVQGTADESNFIAGFDVMRAELARSQREAVFERVEGADHGLDKPGQMPPDGLLEVLGRVANWFLRQ